MSGLVLPPMGVLTPGRLGRNPGEAVTRLAEGRLTGVLRGPAGALYFADGLVVHAESDHSPDLAALLTGCGRITPEAWRDTVRSFGPQCRVGEALVEQRSLSRGELEICHLGALYDAAFFVLDCVGAASWNAAAWASGAAEAAGSVGAAAPTRSGGLAGPSTAGCWSFESGVRHWLGPVSAVSAFRLCREVDRRRRLLERIWPWPQVDTAPVRPVACEAVGAGRAVGAAGAVAARQSDGFRAAHEAHEGHVVGEVHDAHEACAAWEFGERRPAVEGGRADREVWAAAPTRVVRRRPSRHQRELLDHVDGRRTPAELARLLGRSAFATTADIRRLAAAGLLATPGGAVPGAGAPGRPAPGGGTPGRAAPRHAAQAPVAPGIAAPGTAAHVSAGHAPAGAGALGGLPAAATVPAGRSAAGHPPVGRTGGLHRRVPGAALAGLVPAGATRSAALPPTPAATHPLTVPDPDIALLTRVRDLLEARL
ncbi:hypothetical protein ACIF6L_29325 [Kitasatospora sp. NPDC086009]|uniref:hypothetical protein n=1 Tax=unclassified Kitasatospora TaxID=2633591 RepID=UPI0037C85763